MAFYRNITTRPITVFLNNVIPVKFQPNETIEIDTVGLAERYSKFLVEVPYEVIKRERIKNIKEEEYKEPVEKSNEKEKIIEIKQPTPNTDLITEPVQEKVGKRGKKKKLKKLNEEYGLSKKEYTVATSK